MSRQRGRIAVQNGMIHPQYVWLASAGALREPMLLFSASGNKVCVKRHAQNRAYHSGIIASERPSATSSFIQFSHTRSIAASIFHSSTIITLDTTATPSPPFSPTSSHLSTFRQRRSALPATAQPQYALHIQSLAPFRSY